MPKGPDPRKETRPLEEVPAMLAQGAHEFASRRFWHAHEAWENAWHALRAAGSAEAAAYLKGMILVAAALENATRGKEAGFKRQMAEGIYALKTHPGGAATLGLADAAGWEDAITTLYADACRQLDWARWNGSAWTAPAPRL
jgi:hypothetical protein